MIQYENLTICQAELSDVKTLTAWWNDSNVMAHAGLPSGLWVTEEEVAKNFAKDLWLLLKMNALFVSVIIKM